MTQIKFIFSLLGLMGFILFQSCQKEIPAPFQEGEVEFAVSIKSDINHLKADITDTTTIGYQLLISIDDKDGISVYNDQMIPLIKFGNSFLSRKLKLLQYDYILTKFMVVSPTGEVLYATPSKSSSLAYLVQSPLPIKFNISADKTTTLTPEVLPIGDSTPEDFGYLSFGMTIIHPIDLYAVVRISNPLSMAPINWQYSNASVQVISNNWQHTFKFDASINHVVLRGDDTSYTFIVNLPDFEPQVYAIGKKTILKSTKDSPVYFDIDINQLKTIEIQPDATAGKDATIIDLHPQTNYGNSLYWEAGYYTEPQLTVMRTTRSLIYFNLNSLPKSAIIQKVYLKLFIVEWDIPVNTDKFMTQEDLLQQIIEPWEEDKVTWSNQPKTTEANQVTINYHPEFSTNMRTYDVTSLFVPIQEIAAPNYGMMLKTEHDSISFPVKFASSDYDIKEYRPKLVIKYSLP